MGRIYLSPPHMGESERQLLLDAFDSNWIAPLGPHVDAFEREFAAHVGVPHALALSSGSAGLHLALRLLGVGPGDRVLVSDLTFAATAFAVTYVGAEPAFIDSDPGTWNMDPNLLAEELAASARTTTTSSRKLPKAVITVDLYGQCPDYDPILAVCDQYGIPVIEDAAEALGSTYHNRPAGSMGRLGVFSFNGNKIITTSGGGMLVSQSADMIQKARYYATQARDPHPYYHHTEIGNNYRLSNILAAIGRGQLAVLDQRVMQRRANNAYYRTALASIPGITLMPQAPYGRSNCWLTCIIIDSSLFGATPEELRLHMETFNIETRPVWKPMHMQPVFSSCQCAGGMVSEDLFNRGLCLPSGSNLTPEELGRIVEGIAEFQKNSQTRLRSKAKKPQELRIKEEPSKA